MQNLLNWVVKRLSPALWRLQMEARIELCEQQLGDLRERFTRFQSRENMRAARSQLTTDRDLSGEVASILASQQSGNGGLTAAQEKRLLWEKMQQKAIASGKWRRA